MGLIFRAAQEKKIKRIKLKIYFLKIKISVILYKEWTEKNILLQGLGSLPAPASATVYMAAIWTGKINKLIFMLILIQECQNHLKTKLKKYKIFKFKIYFCKNIDMNHRVS
jgi:hypothetical protein